jgi:vacuolar-type H+-ATPase subunit H
MDFNPRFVDLLTLDLKLGSSDFHLNGELSNFIPYVFKGQTVSGSVHLSSMLVNAHELLPERDDQALEAGQLGSDSILPVPPDSLAEPARIKIPENIGFAVGLDMKRVEYDKIVLENISGEMQVTEGVAILDHLSMEVIEGTLNITGWVDTRGEFMEMDVALDMEGADIASSYETFVSVERLAPMARFFKGKANVHMKYASRLDATFTPLYESIDANGQVFTKGLQFYRLDEFIRFSEMLKNEKFQEMAPDEVYLAFIIQDGRIVFDPFEMKVYDSEIMASGSHGIDHTMDYLLDMKIAKSDLGAGANEMMRGISALAAGAGIKIPESDHVKVKANITGTFSKPMVKTDLTANLRSTGETVKEIIEAKVAEEVEKVEEQVREEAGAEAEKIISDAEVQADRLVEEARKAGEELVKEAEKQGDNLVEEAGNSVLKQIAAKKAAEEIKKQAVKQSENLVKEAEGKAAEIIQKAREEAAKI